MVIEVQGDFYSVEIALELMRQVRSLGATPGIALSGYATEEDVRQSQEAGFAVHLAKPVTFAALESAIRRVASASSRVDTAPAQARKGPSRLAAGPGGKCGPGQMFPPCPA